MCLEGRKRLFNPAKLFDGEYLHRQRDSDLMLSGLSVGKVLALWSSVATSSFLVRAPFEVY
jgi:hypothetical protein